MLAVALADPPSVPAKRSLKASPDGLDAPEDGLDVAVPADDLEGVNGREAEEDAASEDPGREVLELRLPLLVAAVDVCDNRENTSCLGFG